MNTKSVALLVVALPLAVAAGACGESKPASDPSTTSSSDPSGEAKEGESCGGAAVAPAKPKTCAAGLTCKNDAGDPTFPGKCTK